MKHLFVKKIQEKHRQLFKLLIMGNVLEVLHGPNSH